MGGVLCYPEALSSLSCLILPKKVNSITANMKKGWILRFRGDQMSLKGIGFLGELTKEKEGCGRVAVSQVRADVNIYQIFCCISSVDSKVNLSCFGI